MANVKMQGNDIYDSHGSKIGSVQGNNIYDSHGSKIGSVDGSNIYDSHGSKIGTLDDARKSIDGGYGGITLAAVWLFFVR